MNKNPHLSVGDQEIITIARQRAIRAWREPKPEYTVGFCEGIIQNDKGIFTAVWCAVIDASGRCFLGGGMHVPLTGVLLQKFHDGILVEADIEAFLQKYFSTDYQQIVEFALLSAAHP